ncbi:MAG: YicC family protein [Clostridiales bacterium]|jgi:uncharacterized protein (TIGR00255 family)|nr:YicC family protein [Clostridiales bacterium]
MVYSMTGYGSGECTRYNRILTVEIKSVNHRYLDVSARLPRALSGLEERVRRRVAAAASRGKIDVYVSFDSFSDDDCAVTLNEPLADACAAALISLKGRYPELKDDLSLSLLAGRADIVTVEKQAGGDADEIWGALSGALENALTAFARMRGTEGANLAEDILRKRDTLIYLCQRVADRAPLVAADYAERLRRKVSEALAGAEYDEARLIAEVTIFADKSCVDEELTRLKSHLLQLKDILEGGGAVGKKLDFLTQEINREVNTIGSKSNDLDITRAVVEMKSELEKIREQVQNIE